MTTTDLKPGDIVQHPEKGVGSVFLTLAGRLGVHYAERDGGRSAWAYDLTGWERVETCTTEAARILEDYQQIVSKSAGVIVRDAVVMMTPAVYEAHHGRETVRPGHVQVRVDDLGLGPDMGDSEEDFVAGWQRDFPECSEDDMRLIHRAIAAKHAKSTPPADEQPASTTVTLPCPDCGGAITREVRPVRMEFSHTPKWSLEFLRRPGAVGERSHACPPAQPDEPTEWGARVAVAGERWLLVHNDYWSGDKGGLNRWDDLCALGTVTLGWDE